MIHILSRAETTRYDAQAKTTDCLNIVQPLKVYLVLSL